MNRGLLAAIAAFLTFFCIADIGVTYLNHGMAPNAGYFGTVGALDDSRYVYTSVNDAGRALGLQPGDVRDWRLWTPQERTDMHYGYAWAGTSYNLPYQRGDRIVSIRTVFSPAGDSALGDAVDIFMRIVLAIAGILLIARGTEPASLYAGCFVCAISVYEGFTNGYAGPPAVGVTAAVIASILGGIGSYVGRFLFGLSLLPQHLPRWVRAGVVVAFVLLATPFYASLISRNFLMPVFGVLPFVFHSIPYFTIQFGVGIYLLFVFGLAAAFTRGTSASAVRLIFAALLVSYVGAAVNFIAAINSAPYPFHGLMNLTYLALAVALPYAVLSKRLVAVDFVVSKTLVYAIVLTAIVGVFVLAEHLIEQAALGRVPSDALELLVPLILGFSFRWIERWTARVVERVLYRDKLHAEQELSALANDFPHARNVRVLARRTAGEIHRHMHAPFVCIYREVGSTYVPIATAGRGDALPIDADDPVFLRLRSTRENVAAEQFDTALPAHGAVFPLLVFGTVTGAIYCHFRESGERFDPDEMETLRKLAHELAIALLWIEREPAAVSASVIRPSEV